MCQFQQNTTSIFSTEPITNVILVDVLERKYHQNNIFFKNTKLYLKYN